MPLKETGHTVRAFNRPAGGTYVLTFSAECAVAAPASYGSWVDLDIIVNGVVVPPTATGSDAFCSSNGGWDYWVRASISVPITLQTGYNSVRVRASLHAGATEGWISHIAIVIHD